MTSKLLDKLTFWGTTSIICLFLLACCVGCATQPPNISRAVPPSALMEDCPVASRVIVTNGDMVLSLKDYKDALRMCNIDKHQLRVWAGQEADEKQTSK